MVKIMKSKLFFFVISLFVAYGCATKKNVKENKTDIQRDSIFITKTIKEVERVTDTLTIEEPCDSLGNLNSEIAYFGTV